MGLVIKVMEQTNSDERNVMAMIGDWREETLDIEALLHSSSSSQGKVENSSIPTQAPSSQSQSQGNHSLEVNATVSESSLPAYRERIEVPQFSSASRPSVLDLSTTIKYQNHERPRILNSMNGHCQQSQRAVSPHQSPHSPHHSPYMQNNPAQQVFNYSNVPEQQMHSPVSPHQRQLHSPVSPHNPMDQGQGPSSPHGHMSPHQMNSQQAPLSPHSPYAMGNRGPVSPVSPHHGVVSPGPMSPHHPGIVQPGAMSPHHPGMHPGAVSPHHISHSGSVSPVPRQHSPAPGASSVFGRYAGSPVSMHSGNSSDTDSYYSACQLAEMRKRNLSVDKNSEIYKAKRERNNVAVRKSREKKKIREQETERRVKDLTDENTSLQNKLDVALKEMSLLKNLYKSIGVQLPQEARNKLENELSKFK